MNIRTPNRQRGLSLIELLISLALGLVLLLGALEIFVRSSQTYRMQDAVAEMQENARFALNLLQTDLRMSGFLGCGNFKKVTPEIAAGANIPNYSAGNVVLAYQNTGAKSWSPTPPSAVTTAGSGNNAVAAANSDIISLMSAGTCAAALVTDMADGDSTLDIDAANACGFAAQDVVIVSDCGNADVVRLTNTPADGKFTHATTLSTAYTASAEVMAVKAVSYFVADDPDSGIPTLYVLDNSAPRSADNPIALFEGIENIQVLFGEDDSGNGIPNAFKSANTVSNWDSVVSAQLTLLMRSSRNLNADTYTLNVGGTSVQYSDGILRKPFSVTVQLRNRG